MTSRELYLRLLRYVTPHRRLFVISLLATALLAMTEPAIPAILKPLLDGSFVDKDPQVMRIMPFLILGLILLRGVTGYVGSVAMRAVANDVVRDLRNAMFERLVHLPVTYFDDHPTGQTISRLTYDVNRVMAATTEVLVILVRDSLATLGLLLWMFYIDWRLSLILFLIAPPTALLVQLISRRLRRISRTLQVAMGEVSNVIQEAAVGNRVVKVFGGQDYERQRFARVNERIRRLNIRLAVNGEATAPVVQFLTGIALAFVVYLATQKSAQNEITVGAFVSLFTAMGMLFTPLKRLTRVNEKLQMGLAASSSIFALLDRAPEADSGSRTLDPVRGTLDFEHVTFAYPARERPILRGVSLRVAAGETVALVGASGSGKSSLISLIPRFYAPHSGVIRLDEVDLHELSLAQLRRNIAYVGQDTVLFNDTLAANIAYGREHETSRQSIEEAARLAHVTDFAAALPQGLDTRIGENGIRLSGGQRQRVAIARALLKDAPLLLLDEATSSLDSHAERQIQAALETLRRGRTAIIIAHRLSTIEAADHIVVLQDGEVIEAGDHASLLDRGGVYAGLYRLQAPERTAEPTA